MKFEKTNIKTGISILEILYVNFQSKLTALTSSAQICPILDLGLEIQKTNVAIDQHLRDTTYANFQAKQTTLDFFGPNLPKNKFQVGNSKN